MNAAWAAPYQGRRVLVLGAGGFIGRRVARMLIEHGAQVVTAFRRPGAAVAGARSASADLATPGAQCLGEQVADFRLRALAADEAPQSALSAAMDLRRPPLLLRGHAATWAAPMDIGNPVVQTSSVRRLADGRLELRLWNPTGQPQPLALAADAWELVFADGRPHTGAVAVSYTHLTLPTNREV